MPSLSRCTFLLCVGLAFGCAKEDKPEVRPKQPQKSVLPKLPAGPRNPGLNVGDLAPEIDGDDVNGKRLKLSDFRGKVVVLDFWGHW